MMNKKNVTKIVATGVLVGCISGIVFDNVKVNANSFIKMKMF